MIHKKDEVYKGWIYTGVSMGKMHQYSCSKCSIQRYFTVSQLTDVKYGKMCYNCRKIKLENPDISDDVLNVRLNSTYTGVGDLSRTYYSKVRRRAKEANLDFVVTIEYLHDLFLEQDCRCALSGVPIKMVRKYLRRYLSGEEQTASLDRIDSSIGYVEGNLQWVHKDINRMKFKYSQEYFIEMCKKVAENENNK